jgi:hypothetical protein
MQWNLVAVGYHVVWACHSPTVPYVGVGFLNLSRLMRIKGLSILYDCIA